MAEVALQGEGIGAALLPRRRALHRLRLGDGVFGVVTRAAALMVLGVIVAVIAGSLPALRGIGFVGGERWHPVTQPFGAIAPIYGTLLTSGIAMLIALSVGLLIVMFFAENAPTASLPVVIFQFALSPYQDWQRLACTGALIITLSVLARSITARALAASRTSP